MKRAGALLTLLLSAGWIQPAGGSQLPRVAQGASGGGGTGPSLRLGFTLGLSAAGMATGPGLRETAGFWFPAGGPVTAVPNPPATALPRVTRLRPPRPNPLRTGTEIELEIAADPPAVALPESRVEIFDAAGRPVRRLVSGQLPPGRHLLSWDTRDDSGVRVVAGVYFVRLTRPGLSQRQKLVVVR